MKVVKCGLLDFILFADLLSIDLDSIYLVPCMSDFGIVMEEGCVFVARL